MLGLAETYTAEIHAIQPILAATFLVGLFCVTLKALY